MSDDRFPNSSICEAYLLGCILRDGDQFQEIADILRDSDFYKDANQRIFRAFKSVYDAGNKIDLQSIFARLSNTGELVDVRVDYLAELHTSAPSSSDVNQYANDVREYSIRRQSIRVANELARNLLEPIGRAPARDILDIATQKLFEIGESSLTWKAEHVSKAVGESLDEYDKRSRGERVALGTGFAELDEKLGGGFFPGELWIVAARTGVGKTSIALSFTANLAHAGHGVLFCSLEQSRRELTDRMICSDAGIDSRLFRTAQLSPQQLALAKVSAEKIASSPIWIDDCPGQGAIRIATAARQAVMRGEIKAVVVDYLQLIEPERNKSNEMRHEQVAAISRRLKKLARELSVPIITPCQLSRAATEQDEPKLSHLRESGAIEQDADGVLLLFTEKSSESTVSVNVAKQRNGPTGYLKLHFDRPSMRFRDPEADLPDVNWACAAEI